MDWALFTPQTIKRSWPGLRVGSYLLPPYEGSEATEPDSIEVIFSGHRNASVEFGTHLREIELEPGTTLVRGAEPINWVRVAEYSDSIVMYPDMSLLQKLAREANAGPIELEPIVLGHDPVMLGVAHIMRRACTADLHISDIEASSFAHLLIRRLLAKQYGICVLDADLPATRMDDRSIDIIGDFIEENLCKRITLEDLAALAQLSPFHFARCFKATTGLAPYQYVIARRIDLARRMLMTSTMTVAEIGWSIGFENISHFRRQFAAHFGIVPSQLRHAAKL
jgi:AraC family transcriptional regulator